MTIPLRRVGLGPGVDAWFTGRPVEGEDPAVGRAGNLSHRRPHLPSRLARDRANVGNRIDLSIDDLVWMDQVHGDVVTIIDADTPDGHQARSCDGLVTAEPGRGLVVQAADCVPVLLRAGDVVGAAHAGRRGLEVGIVPAIVSCMRSLTTDPVRAVLGPGIGGCCYELPSDVREAVVSEHPEASATTTWGTPSIDLRAGLRAQLGANDVDVVAEITACTRHDPGWFSHRADSEAGRQLAIVVRRADP